MTYHSNFIGSLFGLFGGQRIIARPDIDDIAGMPETRIKILRTIADSDRLMAKIMNKPEMIDSAIKADKIADYQERILQVNGYFTGVVDFEEIAQIKQDMAEDWWLYDTQSTHGTTQ